MTYIAPDLSIDVVLLEQVNDAPELWRDTVLGQPTEYAPPHISVQVVLDEPLVAPPVLDIVLCVPNTTDPIDPEEPVDPEPPLEYAPTMPNVAACFKVQYQSTHGIDRNYAIDAIGSLIAAEQRVRYTPTLNITQSFSTFIKSFISLVNSHKVLSSQTYQLATYKRAQSLAYVMLVQDATIAVSPTIGYSRHNIAYSAKVAHYNQCGTTQTQSTVSYATSKAAIAAGQHISQHQRIKSQHAVAVPCRYYPIPEPPPIKPINSCRIRPPSSELPLRMSRQRNGLLSSNLPLSLTCWHDDPPLTVPNLRSYIVHNVINATIGGIAIDLLSFGIKTDKNSYCWQGSIDITPKDYAKIKAKLDVPRGSEPLINAVINGLPVSFIAEDHQRNRQFANHTHSISGRSITARLGADYALSQGGLIDQASFVSQIAAQQLNGLSVSVLDWDIADWLVPADTYSVAGKTPIAVIADIAKAGGGFVTSDLSQPTLSLRRHWKVAAWDIATATPDVIVPIDVMRQISDKRRVNPRYNVVFLNSDADIDGAKVFRSLQAQNAEAPMQSHPLYTDRDAMVPAGTAILSDSGIHGDYTLKLRLADKYNIPLAKLGDIWQVNDPEGAWRGEVNSVDFYVEMDNDAPTVWQTISIDRYLDS